MSQQTHFVKDVLNGVEIDRPVNHELVTYSQAVHHDGSPISPYDHAGSAIRSIKYKGVDRYDESPVFTVQFKVEFDSIQEIAANLWRLVSPAKIVEILNDGIIVEADCLAACSVDIHTDPVKSLRYDIPEDCWFEKQVILAAGTEEVDEETLEAIEDNEHWCTGNIYEYAIGAVPLGAESATNFGEMTIDLFDYEGSIFTMTDEQALEEMWETPDILTVVTAPDGREFRVLNVMHED